MANKILVMYIGFTPLLINTIGSIIVGVIVALASVFVGVMTYGFQIMKNQKILGAPNRNVNDVIHSMKRSEEPGEMNKFIHKTDDLYNSKYKYSDKDSKKKEHHYYLKRIDHEWLKTFIAVCHWSGLRIVLTKDFDHDIEDKNSPVYDEEELLRASEKSIVINKNIISRQRTNAGKTKSEKDKITKFLEI